MGREPTTRLQISGYRFLLRRMAHALVRGDVRMLDDPLRAQSLSLLVGCVGAVLVVAACALLAFLRPGGAIGGAPIVMERTSGALYVRMGDTLHPVPNLASARLIAGTPADPEVVDESAMAGVRRGPLAGIPGAPAALGEPLSVGERGWTACDHGDSTILLAGGNRTGDGVARLASGDSVLVSARAAGAAATYLLYDGWRARVDLRDAAVVRALRLDGVVARPVSPTVLEAFPEAPPITAPRIAGAGEPGPSVLPGLTVGTVVRMQRAEAAEYYVVLPKAVQRIGEVAADLIRFTVTQPGGDIRTIAADLLAAVQTVDVLPVTTFPRRSHAVERPVLCADWTPGGGQGSTNTSVLIGDSLQLDDAVTLAQADGDGPNIDSVLMPAGRRCYLRSTGVSGGGGSTGSLFLLNDRGVLFGIRDESTAERLGLQEDPVAAPWPMLTSLPRGPELSTEAASVLRDRIASS